jgi:hypothetical protein
VEWALVLYDLVVSAAHRALNVGGHHVSNIAPRFSAPCADERKPGSDGRWGRRFRLPILEFPPNLGAAAYAL